MVNDGGPQTVVRFREFGVPEIMVFHHFDLNDDAAKLALRYLIESGREYALGKGRAVVFHRAHIPKTQDHLHFIQNGQRLYALNRDGTAHDRSHGKEMHRWAMDAVKDKYPDFVVPPAGLIESMFEDAQPILETAGLPSVLLAPAILVDAERFAAEG